MICTLYLLTVWTSCQVFMYLTVCDVCCETRHLYVSCYIELGIWERQAWHLTVLALSLSFLSMDLVFVNAAFKNYSGFSDIWE